VVYHLVLVAANKFLGVPSCQTCRSRVDKRRLALSVQPIYSLARGVQDQFVLAIELFDRLLGLLAFGDVA
jgi:hypothetical protein